MNAKHRYLAEFEVRWNMSGLTERERFDTILKAAPGLRFSYEQLTV